MEPIPTFGEEAVGYNFNPSGLFDVQEIKRYYADIIDKLSLQAKPLNSEQARMYQIAIEHAQTACMWAVKAITS